MKKIPIRAIGSNLITFIAALVPVFKSCPPCPLCMPKYAAILAFFGLELADYIQYLIPVMLVSMAISLGSMFYQIRQKKLKYYTFFGALLSSFFLIISKFVFDSTLGSYIFMGTLLTSTLLHHRYVAHTMNKGCCCSKKCSNRSKKQSIGL